MENPASLQINQPGHAARSALDPRVTARLNLILGFLIAFAVYFLLQSARLAEVWSQGGFYDTDDAMRMVQVRDLMAGQAWYDMTAWRLNPPAGVLMHWSRIVDVPLVILIKFFSLFLAPDMAERAARVSFPALAFATLLGGGAWAAGIFAGAHARVFGLFAVLLSGVMYWQFPPGRIDHHGPQITLLFLAVAALARALDDKEARWAALTGSCMALSMGIGLENMPFFALLAAVPGVVFVLRGAQAREVLRWFAAGFSLSLIAVFVLTIGPRNWGSSTCDALARPWIVPALIGAGAYGLMSFAGRLPLAARLAILALGGGAALGSMLAFWPECLREPYANVDPLLKRLWMDHIGENLTLMQDFAIAPGAAWLMTVPTLIGLFCALWGAATARGLARARWLLLAATIAVGLGAATQCLRVFSSTMPLAALALLAVVEGLRRALARRAETVNVVAAALALFALSSFGVAVAMPDLEPSPALLNSPDLAWRRPDPCIESANFSFLAGLKPGLVAGPISPGSYVLAHSGMSVLAAPYHRNNAGNLAALNILRAPPAQAEILARKAGVKYVMLCWATPADRSALRAMSLEGLAARMEDGQVPAWLREVSPGDAPVHLYEVLPSSD